MVPHAIQQPLPTKTVRNDELYKIFLSLAALLNHPPAQVGDGGSDGVDFNEEHHTLESHHTPHTTQEHHTLGKIYTPVLKTWPCQQCDYNRQLCNTTRATIETSKLDPY